MPRVQDLVELKYSAIDAKHLGFVTDGVEGVFSALSALGNNSQANAYQIIGNVNQFTTVTSTTNSVKLPLAITSANGEIVIKNADSADNLYLFPGLGDTINNLAANTAIQVPPGITVIAFRINDTKWIITASYVDLTTGITGILPVINGGTNLASYAQGDIIYASASTTLVSLGKDTTATRYLANTGTSNNPKWDVINLTNGVTGTLPVANGGTNTTTLGVGTSWSPTLTGFSANPATNDYSYTLIGKICFMNFRQSVDGTSNATGYTFTLPFTAVTRTNARWNFTASVVDNGVSSATLGRVVIQSAGTVGTITRDDLGTVFTASGGKRASFQGWYEIA